MPHEPTENFQNCRFRVSSSLNSMRQPIISQLDCDVQQKVKVTQQPATTSAVIRPRCSEALLKARLSPVHRGDAPKLQGLPRRRSAGRAQSPGQRPSPRCTSSTSEVEQIGLQGFAYSTISTDLSPTNTTSSKCFHSQQDAEGAFQEHQIPKLGFLCCGNRHTYFSLAKTC